MSLVGLYSKQETRIHLINPIMFKRKTMRMTTTKTNSKTMIRKTMKMMMRKMKLRNMVRSQATQINPGVLLSL